MSGELLSSWIERIGLFYGIGYSHASGILQPSRTTNERGINDDLDSSDSVRKNAIIWTGVAETIVPEVLPDRDEGTLEVAARLAYCPECWNRDVENGHSPFVRRSWTDWACVTCWYHSTWLRAREPHAGVGDQVNGWAPVWQSNRRWAQAAHLRFEPALGSIALGFESHVFEGPDCTWSDLELEFHRLKRGLGLAILARVAMRENLGVRSRVSDALEVGEHRRRITDANLRGYKRSRPGWIADRISSLVSATEILRLLDHRGAAIERVRRELERHPASQRLVDECRALQYQNQCQ
jgi:hypothetical protein